VTGFSEVIVVGDVNEDGLPDLISGARSTVSGATDVLRGVDVASLAPLGTLTEAVAPTRLVDVDDDGHLDLAMMGPGHVVKVKYGDGTGGFPETTGVQACTCSTQFADVVLWGDLNEDGMLDLVRCGTGSVSVFPGTGGRTFSALPILFTPRSTSFHAMADFNEDGHLDLAGVNESFSGGTDYHLLAGDGTGNLSAPQNLVPVDAWPEPMSMGDVDEDGHLDLLVAHRSSGILILPGNGDGTIGTPVRVFNGFFVRGTALGDLNGDGHLDLVAGRFTSEAVAILLGDGQGGFAPIGSYRVGGVPRQILIEDLDVDGDLDIAVAAASGVSILYNRSFIPHIDCRLGTVNALAGPPVDVLFVNGSAGFGRLRQLTVRPGDPFDISVLAPPSNPMGPAPITVWTWTKVPTRESVRRMPAGLGFIGNPTPIIPGDLPRPRHIANSIGFPRVLGRENWPQRPTDPAPVQLLSLSGLPRADFSFYIQGIIRDSFGPNGATAIMNGIEVIVNP
jgi:hypothetical protein